SMCEAGGGARQAWHRLPAAATARPVRARCLRRLRAQCAPCTPARSTRLEAPAASRRPGPPGRIRLMGMELWLTLAVLCGAVYLFVTEKLPVDVVALLVLASLLVLGLVTPGEALSGFSSEATITVGAMFVLSAGLQRSGALLGMGEALARIRWPWLFALVMMLVVAFVSAFVNNTAAVAVFLPLVISAAIASRKAPSDRKSTRLNSSHVKISYAVFCLKKKTIERRNLVNKI